MSKSVTETGIRFTKSITREEHREVGLTLGRIEHGLQWAIGDWYNAIRWGDKEEACEAAGIGYRKATQYGWVASQYQITGRIVNLSFTHYEQALSVPEPQRASLLERAAAECWSIRQLRKERDKLLGKEKPLLPAPAIDDKVNALLASLPSRVSGQVKKEIQSVFNDLKQSYQNDVRAGVREHMKKRTQDINQMNKEAEEMMEAAQKLRRGVKAFMDTTEYKLILGCLHSDRECDPGRKDKAFQIFRRMGDEVFRIQ